MKQGGDFKTRSSKTVHKNPRYSVRSDRVTKPSGQDSDFYVVVREPGVFVVAVTDDKDVLLVRQFRYTTQMDSVELPAGRADGDDSLVAAKRELEEETGYIARSWEHLGRVQGACGMSNQMYDAYLATELQETRDNDMEEESITELLKVSVENLDEMIKNGEVIQSIGAYFMARMRLAG